MSNYVVTMDTQCLVFIFSIKFTFAKSFKKNGSKRNCAVRKKNCLICRNHCYHEILKQIS